MGLEFRVYKVSLSLWAHFNSSSTVSPSSEDRPRSHPELDGGSKSLEGLGFRVGGFRVEGFWKPRTLKVEGLVKG